MFRISIKHALMAAIAGLVALTALVTQVTSHVATERALVGQMQEIVARDTLQAARQTRVFLEAPETSARTTTALLETGVLSIDEPATLEAHLMEILKELPQVAGAFVASPEGDFVYVSRDTTVDPAITRTKVISVEGTTRLTTLTWRSEEGRIVTTHWDPSDTYDPTTRPWYSIAIHEGGGWSEPYVFFTAHTPGITTSLPVLEDGDVAAVVGIDVELAGVSSFLAELETSANSSAIIVNDDLTVVAHPSEEVVITDGDDLRYQTLDELDDPESAAAHRAFVTSGLSVLGEVATPVSFQVGDGRHHAAFTALDGLGLPWLIAVEAPESDYLGVVAEGRQTAVVWAIVLAAGGMLGAYLVARGLSRPIEELAARARSVAGGVTDIEPVHTRFTEIEETVGALHGAHTELDRKVLERTEALESEARERKVAEEIALSASKAKSDYLASVSHELRTPLTSIVGFAELLNQPEMEIEGAERTEYIDVIRGSGQHLLSLIDELLDLARIEAGESTLDENEVELTTLVGDVTRLLSPQARKKGVSLASAAASPITVRADDRRLRQIALNLIGNALKYTPAGGQVVVDVRREADRVAIEVTDTGVGMTEEEIRVARHRFGRVADSADLATGTGLGLALTEQMIAAHDGGIDITSVKGEGTTMIAWLPADRLISFA